MYLQLPKTEREWQGHLSLNKKLKKKTPEI